VKVCYGFHIKTAAVDVVRGTPPLAAKACPYFFRIKHRTEVLQRYLLPFPPPCLHSEPRRCYVSIKWALALCYYSPGDNRTFRERWTLKNQFGPADSDTRKGW